MDIVTLLTIVAAIATIISFISSNNNKGRSIFLLCIVGVLLFVKFNGGTIVKENSSGSNESVQITYAPTQRPTERPTQKPTERPTQRPTEKSKITALATDKLSTRSQPTTNSTDMGTYFLKGQWVVVLGKHYDSQNEIWWLKVDIGGQQLWTGAKRFDSSSYDFNSVPTI